MKLKPCPFCGSSRVYVRLYNQPSVCCEECLAMGPGSNQRLTRENKEQCVEEASEKWNGRDDIITLIGGPPGRPSVIYLADGRKINVEREEGAAWLSVRQQATIVPMVAGKEHKS